MGQSKLVVELIVGGFLGAFLHEKRKFLGWFESSVRIFVHALDEKYL